MKITHFFMDEEKFFKTANLIFIETRIQNQWYIFNESGNLDSWQDKPSAKCLRFSDLSSENFVQQLVGETVESSNISVFHYFDPQYLPFFYQLSKRQCVIIQFWGGDYSPRFIRPSKLIGFDTYKLLIHPNSRTKFLAPRVARVYHDLKWAIDFRNYAYKKSIRKASHAGFELGAFECNFFKMKVNRVNDLHIPYSSDTRKLMECDPIYPTGRNILLGNSAAISNSHIDMLQALSRRSADFDNCIIPLSYGGTKNNIDSISIHADKLLGSKSCVLPDFLPKTAYFKLIDSCSFVLMNHTRQQALGNILWALANGRTLYLNPNGVIYARLKTLGFHVFNLKDIEPFGLIPLNREQQSHNSNLLPNFYPPKAQLTERLQEIYNSFCQ